jgi:coenzyme A diphosphatase NUDT7
VTPVVGIVPAQCRAALRPAEAEVDAVFDVPLDVFLRESSAHSVKDVQWRGTGLPYRLHFFEYEGFTIWGLTAAIMIQVIHQTTMVSGL